MLPPPLAPLADQFTWQCRSRILGSDSAECSQPYLYSTPRDFRGCGVSLSSLVSLHLAWKRTVGVSELLPGTRRIFTVESCWRSRSCLATGMMAQRKQVRRPLHISMRLVVSEGRQCVCLIQPGPELLTVVADLSSVIELP